MRSSAAIDSNDPAAIAAVTCNVELLAALLRRNLARSLVAPVDQMLAKCDALASHFPSFVV